MQNRGETTATFSDGSPLFTGYRQVKTVFLQRICGVQREKLFFSVCSYCLMQTSLFTTLHGVQEATP